MQCKQCGSCCRGYPDDHVWLNKRDVKRLAKYFGIDFEAALRKFSVEGHLAELRCGDCVHLDGNSCSIYEARPEHCRHFPPGSPECKEARSRT